MSGDWWISVDGVNGLMGSDDDSIPNVTDETVIINYCLRKDAPRLGFLYWLTAMPEPAAKARLERIHAQNPQINLPSTTELEPSAEAITFWSARAGVTPNMGNRR